jgi:hypothetical protein
MGGPYNPGCPRAVGPVPYALGRVSSHTNPDARTNLETLRNNITALAPTYQGLAAVLENDLLTFYYSNVEATAIRSHLEAHWFDAPAATEYFPSEAVAEIYAKGLLETLNTSLSAGPPPLPIYAVWWIGHPKVRLTTSLDPDVLSLDILTPVPRGAAPTQTAPILGETTVWVTEDVGGRVATNRFEGDRNAPTKKRK